MNVLVTGGTGFIGATLAERFVVGGHGVAVMDDGSNGNARRPLGVAAFPEADVADADLGDFLQRRSRRRGCIWRRGWMAASPCVRPAEGPRSMCAAR